MSEGVRRRRGADKNKDTDTNVFNSGVAAGYTDKLQEVEDKVNQLLEQQRLEDEALVHKGTLSPAQLAAGRRNRELFYEKQAAEKKRRETQLLVKVLLASLVLTIPVALLLYQLVLKKLF